MQSYSTIFCYHEKKIFIKYSVFKHFKIFTKYYPNAVWLSSDGVNAWGGNSNILLKNY